jgi:hypothetical protein
MEKKECTFEGKDYSEGRELCDATRCMLCTDGKWVVDWISPFGP